MKNTKKILSGILAMTMVAGLAACNSDSGSGNGGGGGAADATTTTEATTTTGVTVAVNTEGLKDDEQEALEGVMESLPDVELENKEIKWLAHYTINPDTNGVSKSVALEMFEQKYGGYVTDYNTTYENRYNDLSTYVLGGEGIDFFPIDSYSFPKGVISGMFQPVDDYIDINSSEWQHTKQGMEIFNFGGKHFGMVTGINAFYACFYNKKTIEEYGLDDPWELYEAGNWNWDTFKGMLLDFVDEDSGLYGLDNWYYEQALYMSSGVTAVANVDGHVVSMLNDPTLEKAMNFGYELYQNGLLLDKSQFNWSTQTHLMGEGRELFDINGCNWGYQGDPATWSGKIEPENLGVVPVPSPAGSDPYACIQLDGYSLCKGAQNPEGVALFAECGIIGSLDERAVAISNRKAKDDNGWTDEIIERIAVCNENARNYPVFELASGCSNDIASYVTDVAETGVRAPFNGSDWATQREMLSDAIEMMVNEVDAELQAKIAEF